MNTKTYTEFVLPKLQAFILEKGGDWILWQDRDSAHTSKETLRWMELHGLDYILSPPKSPDLSVMETWVSPIRRDFWQQRPKHTPARAAYQDPIESRLRVG
ncbi:hypothetical protein yc1106_01897 [Curvularia clavata]|uniref:Tc1-like transposase DDE domain-containing protein n=1 Tax=Curvularia clavata TaxID=95742 RepID=A0A9Q8Z5D7_CURCL|nr:hypothetical protein yc1106_01897 [Curvularia clavata]